MNKYKGNEPFVFALCAHKDEEAVSPVIQALQKNTVRVCFHASEDKPSYLLSEVEESLKQCHRVLIFITKNSLSSPVFRKEMNYALSLEKGALAVFMEDVKLSGGNALRLSAAQHLYKSRQPSEESFLNELVNAEFLQCCKAHTNSDAYEGQENYVFISYAHKDDHAVLPIIKFLTMSGFRVWYDSGIKAGSEWPDDIEYHLDHCVGVLAFISPASVASKNCRNEINYALGKEKEVMAVYLEPTTLIRGMGMQLSSVQSLNKYSFDTDEDFLKKLLTVDVLKYCHKSYVSDGREWKNDRLEDTLKALHEHPDLLYGQNTTERVLIKEMRKNGPSLIANVATIASNEPQNPWPSGPYTQVINSDKYCAVYFHAKLLVPAERDETKAIGLLIYDAEDTLVHQNVTSLLFARSNDRFSVGWIIRDDAGMKQKDGVYTAILWYDNSRAVEYKFRVTSQVSHTFDPSLPEDAPENLEVEQREKEIKKIIRRQKYPMLFLINLLAWALMYLGFGFAEHSREPVVMLLPLVCAFAVALLLVDKTKKYVVPHIIPAVLLVFAGCGLYTLFLGFMSLLALINRKKLKARLKALINPFDN